MGGKGEDKSKFAEIVIKAYEKGTNDRAITVQKLIEDIKTDLMKTGQFHIKVG